MDPFDALTDAEAIRLAARMHELATATAGALEQQIDTALTTYALLDLLFRSRYPAAHAAWSARVTVEALGLMETVARVSSTH